MTQEIDNILSRLDDIQVQQKLLKQQQHDLEADLIKAFYPDTFDKIKDKPYQCGSVTHTHGDRKITVTVPKKVTWNQEDLAACERGIIEAGDDPLDYIQVKRTVSETAYSSFPQKIKNFFEHARTVERGATTVKIK